MNNDNYNILFEQLLKEKRDDDSNDKIKKRKELIGLMILRIMFHI